MVNLQAGAVVELKSGSVPMTVTQILDDGRLVCRWMDPEGKVQKDYFPPAALQEVEGWDEE